MKRKSLLFIVLLIVMLAMILVACAGGGKKIPVPANLTIEDDVLSWDAVTGAVSYDVRVDDNVYVVEENSYTFTISDYEQHEVSVRANTYNGTGKYSSSIIYKRRQTKATLPQLSAPRISMTSNRVMWGTVLNNNGYKIIFDGKTYTVPKNATYYDLTFTKDGRFEVTMQTLGDGVSYASSVISSPYLVTVQGLQAKPLQLPQVEFTFNAEEKVLEWKNRYSADAVSYEIYRDDVAGPVATIAADDNSTRQTYAPTVVGTVTYTMRLISMDGLYAASEYNSGVTFPISDSAPQSLAVRPDSDLGEYCISWSSCVYQDGYVVEITTPTESGGAEILEVTTKDLSTAIPTSLSAGRHIARVRTKGEGKYYADSLYSRGVVFYTDEGGVMTTLLDTPVIALVSSVTDQEIALALSEVEGATNYRLCFVGASGEYSLTVSELNITLTPSTIGSVEATAAEGAILAKLFADLESGVTLAVSAIPDDELYSESMRSEEVMLTTSEEIVAITAPGSFDYGLNGFTWITSEGVNETCILLLDGVLSEVSVGERISVSEGSHVARIRREGEYALWSREIFFRAPLELEPPTELKETSGVLQFQGSKNATAYVLYVGGRQLATIYPNEYMIDLSAYIMIDGYYVLSLKAISSGGLRESVFSEELLYIKTDEEFGTESKPFVPQSPAELLSLMKAHPGAYFRLVAGKTYDFEEIEIGASDSIEFNGVIRGNNATLKGLNLSSPFFSTLKKATISDLTLQINVVNYSSVLGGILAPQTMSSLLKNVKVKISGNVRFNKSSNFGILFNKADDLVVEGLSLDLDFALKCGEACTIGALAYETNATVVSDYSLLGKVKAEGTNARFSGISVLGDINVSGYASTVSAQLIGSLYAVAAGCSLDGRVTVSGMGASEMATEPTFLLKAPIVDYYGVAMQYINISDSTIGGRVQSENADTVNYYGIGFDEISYISNVAVATTMIATAAEQASVMGLAERLEGGNISNAAFTGRIELNGSEETTLTAAGCVNVAKGAIALKSIGTIAVNGGEATVTAGAISAEDLTLDLADKLILSGVKHLEFGGAVISASDHLSVMGSTVVETTEEPCDVVHFGGVAARGNVVADINGYTVTGGITAGNARIAGVTYQNGNTIAINSLDLTVNLDIVSQDIMGAGLLLGAKALSLPENAAISVTLNGDGSGSIGGLALNLNNLNISNINIAGSLMMEGEGAVYGVAQTAREVRNITSTLSLSAQGDVELYGLFERVSAASDLSYTDGEVTIRSDNAKCYGLVGAINGLTEEVGDVPRVVPEGFLPNMTLSGVTFDVSPLGEANQSTLLLCGLGYRLSAIEWARIYDVTYDIGAFDTMTFGGLAYSFSDSVTNSYIDYTLRSAAKEAEIGGAFVEGGGTISSLQIGGTFYENKAGSPSVKLGEGKALTVTLGGTVAFGGILMKATNNVAVSGGSTDIDINLALADNDEASVGGVLSLLPTYRSFVLSNHGIKAKMRRTTAKGLACLGGVVSDLRGYMQGATVNVDIESSVATDLIGGVAAKSAESTYPLSNSLVKGSIVSSARVGGLIGECTSGTVEKVATILSITSQGENAGGLFSVLRNTTLKSAYSIARLSGKGYGFFKEGENLSISYSYFAGVAPTCTLADSVTNCATKNLFVDVALNDLDVVHTGTLACEYRSFAYGYNKLELGNEFVTDGVYYPYLSVLGNPMNSVVASEVNLTPDTPLEIKGTVNLYSITDLALPRLYPVATPTISWIDRGGRLEIENDVARVVDNGAGVLCGYLSGGVCVYRVSYVTSGFVPFEIGDSEAAPGTSTNPYLIKDIKYFPHIVEYDGTDVYFKVMLDSESVRDASLAALFTEDNAFCGHIDFNGVKFISPEIGVDGIFGYIDGGTIENLVLSELSCTNAILARSVRNATISSVEIVGSVDGESRFVYTLEDSMVEGLTLHADCIKAADFALFDMVDDSTVENVSMRVNVSTGDAVTLAVFASAIRTTAENMQVLLNVKNVGKLTAALVLSDDHSTYTSVMMMADISAFDEEESDVAGFALMVDGSVVTNSAFLTMGSELVLPLIKEVKDEGDAPTYASVLVCSDAPLEETGGVSVKSVVQIYSALAEMSDYVAGALYTPLGFTLLLNTNESTPDYSFVLTIKGVDQEEEPEEIAIEITADVSLDSLFLIEGEQPLSCAVGYSFVGDCATIEDGTLRLIASGQGTLTVKNIYGEMVNITVNVIYDGFSSGKGTAEEPYLINTFDDFLKAFTEEDICYFTVTGDLSGEVSEPLVMKGFFTGAHVTITVDLTGEADVLFSSGSGEMKGINFLIRKANGSVSSGALFMATANGLTIEDASITVECSEILLEYEGTFGWVFGEMSYCELTDVEVIVRGVSPVVGTKITAVGGVIGVVAGAFEEGYATNVTVNGDITLSASGDVIFGAFGQIKAMETSHRIWPNEDDYETFIDEYYIQGITLNVSYTLDGGDLVVGGVAGESSVTIENVTGSVTITVGSGGDVSVGGVVGYMSADVLNCDLTAIIDATPAVDAAVTKGRFGGLVGEMTDGSVSGCTVDATIDATTQGSAFAGGAVGSAGYGSVEGSTIIASIRIHSDADGEEVAALIDPSRTYSIIVAAGGAIGYTSGGIVDLDVTPTEISATSDYSGDALYVLAGGAAGFVRDAENNVVASGTVTAEGGVHIADQEIAVLDIKE